MELTKQMGSNRPWLWGGLVALIAALGIAAWAFGWFGGEDAAAGLTTEPVATEPSQ